MTRTYLCDLYFILLSQEYIAQHPAHTPEVILAHPTHESYYQTALNLLYFNNKRVNLFNRQVKSYG